VAFHCHDHFEFFCAYRPSGLTCTAYMLYACLPPFTSLSNWFFSSSPMAQTTNVYGGLVVGQYTSLASTGAIDHVPPPYLYFPRPVHRNFIPDTSRILIEEGIPCNKNTMATSGGVPCTMGIIPSVNPSTKLRAYEIFVQEFVYAVVLLDHCAT